MASSFTCPNGHRWLAATPDAGASTNVATENCCPTCGMPGTQAGPTAFDQTLAHPKPSGETVNYTADEPTPLATAAYSTEEAPRPSDQTVAFPPPSSQTVAHLPSAGPDQTIAQPPLSDQTLAVDGTPQDASEVTLGGTPDDPVDRTINYPVGGPERKALEPTVAESAARQRKLGRHPAEVPGYEILDVLGRGGMGVVYKARQIGLNRLTALKMILAGGHASADDVKRFQIEAEAVAKLQHPNIVQIYEVGNQGSHPYFSLEYIDGGTLQGKIGGKPMVAVEAAVLTEQLAHAVHFAHQHDIIHRDLKPANVLLTRAGVPKITDFGLAKRLDDDDQQHTGTGSILGTPSYMSPEQTSGHSKKVGPPADIYALGALLYDMLTGRPPFCGESVLDTLQQVRQFDPVPPSHLAPRVPRDLETICLKCLQKEPPKRYATAGELAADLRRFLNNEPILARPVGWLERGLKWMKRRPAIAALLGTLAVVVALGFSVISVMWVRAEALRIIADQQRAIAFEQRQEAVKQAEIAEKHLKQAKTLLYDANMAAGEIAVRDAKVGRLREILRQHALDGDPGSANKGFEWHYLKNLDQSEGLALKSHVHQLRAVAFVPGDERRLASGANDGSVVFWHLQDFGRSKQQLFTAHGSAIHTLTYSQDGRRLASASDDGRILLWDLSTAKIGEPKQLPGHRQAIQTLSFSAQGDLLASGGDDGIVKLWNLAQGREVAELTGHKYGITSLAFNPEGTLLASASLDRTARLWKIKDAGALLVALPHPHWVHGIAFNPEGTLLATASADKVVRLWNVDDHQIASQFEGCGRPPKAVAFSPDGQRLAALCTDGSLVAWDLLTKRILKQLTSDASLMPTLAFSADGQALSVLNFDLTTHNSNRRNVDSPLLCAALTADGTRVASGGIDGVLYVWGPDGPREVKAHQGPIRDLVFSALRNAWITAGEDGKLAVWPLEAATPTSSWLAHDRWVTALGCDRRGQWLASASADRTVKLWDAGKLDSPPVVLRGHTDAVHIVAVSPTTGSKVASGSANSVIKVWDRQGRSELMELRHPEGDVYAVAFSPDERLLATAGSDRIVYLWDLESGGKLSRQLRGHTNVIRRLLFSDDGQRLVSASDDRTLKLWDVNTGQETQTLRGHEGAVTGIAFDARSTHLLSVDNNGVIFEWDGRGN